jgi:hypothetical protein
MAQGKDRLEQVVREARRNAEARAAGYREQALKLYPWVCGVCGRTFTHANLRLLEVHHKSPATTTTTRPTAATGSCSAPIATSTSTQAEETPPDAKIRTQSHPRRRSIRSLG